MSLQVWLPLDGSLRNLGTTNPVIENLGGATVNASGKIGSCYSFDNTANATLRLPAVLAATDDFSIALWVKFNSNANQGLYSQRIATDSKGFSIFMLSGTSLRFDDGISFSVSYTFNTTDWYHLVFCRDASYKYIYINGELIQRGTRSTTDASKINSNYTLIGGSQNTAAGNTNTGNYLNGYLNDYRIYNHCLSAAEVREIARGLVLHYKLDDTLNYNWVTETEATVIRHASDNKYAGISFNPNINQQTTVGYRIELDAKASADNCYFRPIFRSDTTIYAGGTKTLATTSWVHYTFEMNASAENMRYFRIQLYPDSNGSGDTLEMKNIRLLSGNIDIDKIMDSSGYGRHLTITGNINTNCNTSRYFASAYFDGTSFAKTTPQSSEIQTLCCWIRTDKNKATSQIAVADSGSQLAIAFYNNGIIGVFGTTRDTGSFCTFGNEYKENDWNHIVVIKTSDTGTRDIYCNGVKLTPGTKNYWTASTGFLIGRRETASPTPFYGNLADVRAYVTQLSVEDIKQLYQLGAKIDNKYNIHSFEFNENNKNKITKQGQIQGSQISEFCELSFLKYDPNIYIEPDGSCWVRVYHHNNPANAVFNSTDPFATSVYLDQDRWFNIEVANYLDKWEIMFKGKYTDTSDEWKLRWIQQYNPMTATYANVAAANITKITDGYNTNPSNYGGLYYRNSSNTYLCANNGTESNWYGAVGAKAQWNGGIPGWFIGSTATVTTTGYNDMYLRIDNINFTTIQAKTTKNNIWLGSHMIEL